MASPNSWNAASKSPALSANGASTLHESFNSLSFSSIGSPNVANATSPASNGNGAGEDGAARPMPIRTPSAGSLPTAQAAIGSGRSGTSPPTSRFNPDLGGNQQNGSQAFNNGYNSGSYSSNHSQHTPSHQLPWPSSAGSAASNQSFSQQQQQQQGPGNPGRNAPMRGVNGQSAPANANGNGHDDLPGLSGNEEGGNRYGLSQPQFNLDHAQLAKSREQRDLDDVDSGQRASATLWMGDLEGWMDETYIRRCITALGWDRDENGSQTIQTSVKMIKGASSTSGYCFITFPTSAHASSVLSHFGKQPPMLMPGSERTFKLNWATGLPGVQPKWEGEWSVFVGDLGREVTEGELVALFTPLFPSTKSAKIMYDPATGMSRGYGFVRFGDENDMTRSLALGQNTSGSGLSLRGRTLRISEASGSGGRNRTTSTETGSSLLDSVNGNAGPAKNPRELSIQVPGSGNLSGLTSPNLLSPNATGFSIPVASPGSPGARHSPYSNQFAQSYGQSMMSPTTPSSPLSPSADPNNTTVFVGGLPACINEETLKSFFQHFGEIAYVKIPPNKGCGFVQFVRRADAELAIAKMHDFPIHGKSRIRLSWGRSQGDKQVEHVRKLASALNVPFEAVWRMVQGQDNSTIKQIASAVGATGPGGRRSGDPEAARGDLARLAGLSAMTGGPHMGMPSLAGGPVHIPGPHDPEAYAFRPAVPTALSPAEFGWAGPPRDNGPYTRVSPSAFAPMTTSNLGGHPSQTVPLSPPPSAGVYGQHGMPSFSSAYSPYTPVTIAPPAGALANAQAGSATSPAQQSQSQPTQGQTASGVAAAGGEW